MDFEQLFKQISQAEISGNLFAAVGALTGNDFFAITAGKVNHYNAMIGSGGGLGLFFKKPTTWCLLRADRYTLELMEKEQAYTLAYFPDKYKEQALLLASKTGRDSEKMEEAHLTGIQTPTGNIAFKEARLIIECKLSVLTTITPDDLRSQEGKEYGERRI